MHAVLLHGAGGGAWEWRDWLTVFENNNIPTTAINLHPANNNLAQTELTHYIQQACDLVSKIKDRPLIFIGASMGGIIALKIAEIIHAHALILLNSIPSENTKGWPPKTKAFPAIIPWSKGISLQDTVDSLPDGDAETIQWAHSLWRDESGKVMQKLYNGVAITHPTRCPTIVITGAEDKTISLVIAKVFADNLNAEFKVFDGVSHLDILLGDQSKKIAEFTVNWLLNNVNPVRY